MNLSHPFQVVGPALDGDVLQVLAAGEVNLTGREIARRAGASQEGVRLALARLVRQGIARQEQLGRAHQYRLNRDHLAAKWIEKLSTLRLELITGLRMALQAWRPAPDLALLFGSVARGRGDEQSDVDILLVRPASLDADEPRWRAQIQSLESTVTGWTGNDTRVLEYGAAEFKKHREREPVLRAAQAEGIELFRPRKKQ